MSQLFQLIFSNQIIVFIKLVVVLSRLIIKIEI